MKRVSVEWVIYLLGLFVFAILYAWIKTRSPNAIVFLLILAAYLFAVRVIGRFVQNILDSRSPTGRKSGTG